MAPPWVYVGPFRIDLKPGARIMSAPPGTLTYTRELKTSTHATELERTVHVLGCVRLNAAGPEYRSGVEKGIPFYWAPVLVTRVVAANRLLICHERTHSAGRICRLCGGSGSRLTPLRRKLLNFVQCTMCEGTGIAKREMVTLDELLEQMRAAGRTFGRRARNT